MKLSPRSSHLSCQAIRHGTPRDIQEVTHESPPKHSHEDTERLRRCPTGRWKEHKCYTWRQNRDGRDHGTKSKSFGYVSVGFREHCPALPCLNLLVVFQRQCKTCVSSIECGGEHSRSTRSPWLLSARTAPKHGSTLSLSGHGVGHRWINIHRSELETGPSSAGSLARRTMGRIIRRLLMDFHLFYLAEQSSRRGDG